MTLPTDKSTITLNGNGSNTIFDFDFRVWEASHLQVWVSIAGAAATLQTSGWSAVLSSDQQTSPGGVVTYPTSGSALTSSDTITIIRDMPFTQGVDLVNNQAFSPEVLEAALDKATAERQQLKETLNRAALAEPGTEGLDSFYFLNECKTARDGAEASAAAASASETAAAASEAVAAQAAADLTRSVHNEIAAAGQTTVDVSSSGFILASTLADIVVTVDGVEQHTDTLMRTSDTLLTLGGALSGGEAVQVRSAAFNPDAEAQAAASAALAQAAANIATATVGYAVAATVADLRALDPAEHSSVRVLGYHVLGDGGGGPERVPKTGAPAGTYVDNGGSVTTPTGGDGSKAWVFTESVNVDPRWFGVSTSRTPTENYNALSQIALLDSPLTIEFNEIYETSARIEFSSKDNIILKGPGGIKKIGLFVDGDAISFKQCNNVTVSGCYFEGIQPAYTIGYRFGDQGLGFFSCQKVKIENNKFVNFGDAAHRVLRSSTFPAGTPTNAFDTIITGNYYEEIHQTSTTTGGARRILFANNVGHKIGGSFKFASRATEAGLLNISGNVVELSDKCFEVVGQDQIIISGNIAKGIKETFVSYYDNPEAEATTVEQLLQITNNNIDQCGQLCRVGMIYNANGFENVCIRGNTSIAPPNNTKGAIVVIGSKDVRNVSVIENKLFGYEYGIDLSATKLTTDDVAIIRDNHFESTSIADIRLNAPSGIYGTIIVKDNMSFDSKIFTANTSSQQNNRLTIEGNYFQSSSTTAQFLVTEAALIDTRLNNNTAITDNSGVMINTSSSNMYLRGNHFENPSGTALRFSPGGAPGFDAGGNTLIGAYLKNSVTITNIVTDLTL